MTLQIIEYSTPAQLFMPLGTASVVRVDRVDFLGRKPDARVRGSPAASAQTERVRIPSTTQLYQRAFVFCIAITERALWKFIRPNKIAIRIVIHCDMPRGPVGSRFSRLISTLGSRFLGFTVAGSHGSLRTKRMRARSLHCTSLSNTCMCKQCGPVPCQLPHSQYRIHSSTGTFFHLVT